MDYVTASPQVQELALAEEGTSAAPIGTMVQRFFQWAERAPATARAQGARALAKTYLEAAAGSEEQDELLLALMVLLDDISPLVRRALAEVFATTAAAPHEVVTVLAHDQSDVALPVLSASPVLSDAELVDAVALGDSVAQTAVARRAFVPLGVAAALAEVGSAEACVALCRNRRADLSPVVLARLVERHGLDGAIREAVLTRPELDARLRYDLTQATARALGDFVTECGWMSEAAAQRMQREAGDHATIAIAGDLADQMAPADMTALVAHLTRSGRLTPALVLRAVLSGELAFVEAAFVHLTGLAPARVAGFVRSAHAVGFGALYTRAGLPAALLPAFVGALSAPEKRATGIETARPTLQRERIARALSAVSGKPNEDAAKVSALLRRLDAEAARADARRLVSATPADTLPTFALLPRVSREADAIVLRPAA